MRQRSPGTIAGLFLIAVVVGCKKEEPTRMPSVAVRVAPAEMTTAPITIVSNGVVEPLQSVAVTAQVSGALVGVAFTEGQDVVAGQVLFQIDPRPFRAALAQAQAALARDMAQAGNAARDASRYSDLAQKDYVTKSQADQQMSNAAAARAQVTADSAAVEAARVNLSYATIRAPITGRTGSLLIRQGNLVNPGAGPLVVINQLRPIMVRFTLNQRDFGALQRRAAQGKVPIRLTSGDSVPIGETGELAFIDNAVDSLTGTVTAKARFLNTTGQLWPGQYVTASVELENMQAVTVPAAAIATGQDGPFVYVIGADKKATVQKVVTGRTTGDRIVIESGVTAGQSVVIDGQSRLMPGAKVEIATGGRGRGAPGGAPAPAAAPAPAGR
jgi:membrane fusion protein, multidrug efflux system